MKGGFSTIKINLIEILKSLSHQNRIRIINLLKQQQLCVCELENIMGVNQSNASRHLRKLKQVNLIKGNKKAQWIYYSLNKDLFNQHNFLQSILEDELDLLAICQDDNHRLKKYQTSEISCKELSDSDIFIKN
jgi:ArsR family transcriptional regulator